MTLRGRVTAFHTDRCEIVQRMRDIDEYGSTSFRRVIVRSDEPCRILRDNRANPALQALDALHIPEALRLSVATDCPLEAGHEVLINGARFDVVEITMDKHTGALDKQAFLRRWREDV